MATTTSAKVTGSIKKANTPPVKAPVAQSAPQKADTATTTMETQMDPKVVAKFLDSIRTNDVEDIVLAVITAGSFDLPSEALDEVMQNVSSALGVIEQNHQVQVDGFMKELAHSREVITDRNEKLSKANDRVKVLCGIIAEM